MAKHNQTVLILDFGSQYTQLIARRVRELKVYSEIVPYSISIDEAREYSPKAIILSGGPSSVYGDQSPKCDHDIINLGVPILGICYGLQLLINETGGSVSSNGSGEYGLATIQHEGAGILAEVGSTTKVWMSHGDRVDNLPEHWEVSARSSNDIIAAVHHSEKPFFGTQFHPEVAHTDEGEKIISNFLFKIAGCTPDWTPASLAEESIKSIRETVGNDRILCAVSGGVDSTVLAVLAHEAVGDRLKPVFIDHGLLRKNEVPYVTDMFNSKLNINLEVHNYSENFLAKLKGVTDPEKKRIIIGNEFIKSFEEIVEEDEETHFLAQGTLYPDVVESGGALGQAEVIKTHHNVGVLPEKMNMELIEPFRTLFKDEVRQLGRELEIPDEILGRHPFPGPGLAVRIIGEITKERLSILREADDIFIRNLKTANIYDEIWQAFSVLVPINTVGVMGDQRTYANLLALRAVTSRDGMTADWYPMPEEVLTKISGEIVNNIEGINRVVYDVSSKPPGTIEWE